MRPLQDTHKKFPRSIWGVSSFYKIQLARNNWKIKGIFSGLVTRRHYFLKKYDAKQPNFPSCRNWPICLVSDLCVMFHGDRFNGGPTNRVRNLSVEARDLRCDGCSETWFRFVIHVDNLRILSQPTIRPKSKSEMQYSYIAKNGKLPSFDQ